MMEASSVTGKTVKKVVSGQLDIRMTKNEISLLSSFLQCAQSYLEFGSGGSTVLAANLVRGHVWSVESSLEWIDRVEQVIDQSTEKVTCHHVDIGPVGLWGYPTDHSARSKFPGYYTRIWRELTSDEIDFVLIDGRFRVASFCEACRHVRDDTLIGFHDYRSRNDYHCVEKIARVIAQVDDLAVFLPKKGRAEHVNELIEKFAYDPF